MIIFGIIKQIVLQSVNNLDSSLPNPDVFFSSSTDWMFGIYGMNLDENYEVESFYNSCPDEYLASDFNTRNYVIFGKIDSDLGN